MKTFITIIILFNLHYTNILIADVLIIDRVNQSMSFKTPQRGLSMNQVIQQFGEPTTKKQAIGNPPITKWMYENFSVYFEKNWVINSVVHKINKQDKGPKIISEQLN